MPIVQGSVWILAATVTTSVAGGLFWLIVARTATTAEVGGAAALFSSVNFVNYLTGLGLAITVARYGGAPTRDSRVLFNWMLLATVASSVVATAGYLPFMRGRADPLFGLGIVPGTLFFAVVAAGAAVSVLVDMQLTVQRRWRLVMIRVAAFSLVRFPLVALASLNRSAFPIFALAAVPPALSGLVIWWFTSPKEWRYLLRPLPSTTREAIHYSLVNYFSQLAALAPFFALPVLVALTVSAKQNAVFFIAWSIAVIIFLVPTIVARVHMAEGSQTRDVARQSRIALGLSGMIAVVAAVAVVAGGSLVTRIYGSGYARAQDLLLPLGVAALPWAFTTVALAHARIVVDDAATIVISVLYAGTVLVASAVLVQKSGALGAAQGWLIGNCVTGIIAGIWLFRTVRIRSGNGRGEHAIPPSGG